MSLDPLHEHLARLVFDLPEAASVAIAGGNAMLAHNLVDRPTQDLDLFTPDEAEVNLLADALARTLRAEGATVEVDRRGPSFIRQTVTMADGRSVAVEIGQDARIRPTVQLAFGRVLDPDEVAADKTLALFGRAAARDLVDVAALSNRYTLDELCRLAAEKDPGFDSRVLADALRAATSHTERAFAELGLSSQATRQLKTQARQWRTLLLETGDHETGDQPGSEGPPPPQRHPETPRPPGRPRHLGTDLPTPPDPGHRNGPGLSR